MTLLQSGMNQHTCAGITGYTWGCMHEQITTNSHLWRYESINTPVQVWIVRSYEHLDDYVDNDIVL